MKLVFVFSGDTMGRGDDELGARLVVKLVHQLGGLPHRPDAILFYNTGVRLLAPASVVADTLAELEHAGVELLACGTCVEHFGLVGQTRAGRVTDMREIAGVMATAERVVTM
jgi:hypothetical protein